METGGYSFVNKNAAPRQYHSPETPASNPLNPRQSYIFPLSYQYPYGLVTGSDVKLEIWGDVQMRPVYVAPDNRLS